MGADVRSAFDRGGMPTLMAKLEELRESMWSRSPHYDVFSGHAAVLAAEAACAPLLYRIWQAGVVSEPVVPVAERRQVLQAIDRVQQTLHKVEAEGFRD